MMIGLFAKALIELVTSVSVGAAMGNVFRTLAPVATGNFVKKGLVVVGEAILTSMIAGVATDHMMAKVEKLSLKVTVKPVEEEPKAEG